MSPPRNLIGLRYPLLALLALCAGCGTSPPASMPENLTFPAGFYFGTATAGFQVEMGCPTIDPAECEDRNSDDAQTGHSGIIQEIAASDAID